MKIKKETGFYDTSGVPIEIGDRIIFDERVSTINKDSIVRMLGILKFGHFLYGFNEYHGYYLETTKKNCDNFPLVVPINFLDKITVLKKGEN